MNGLSIASLMRWASHHFLSVTGQLAAAAPIVLVTMIISHQVGLEPAGKFVVAAGITAVVFTTASLGLHAFVVVERLQNFDTRDFLITRAIAVGFVSLALIAASPLLSIPSELISLVAILRLADSAVEMAWGIDIHRLPSDRAMCRYAVVNSLKLIVIVVPAAFLYFIDGDVIAYLLAGAGLSCVLAWYWLYWNAWDERTFTVGVGQIRRSADLARGAFWFATGHLVVAFTSNSPRILADRLFTGDMLGVVGVTLSFCSILGMVFLSSWLRWFPKLTQERRFGTRHAMFVIESAAILIILFSVGYTVLPFIVSMFFGFDYMDYKDEVRGVIISSLCFMFGLNLTNMFKTTKYVWLELIVCLTSVALSYILLTLNMKILINGYLVAAGTFMAASSVLLNYLVQKDSK